MKFIKVTSAGDATLGGPALQLQNLLDQCFLAWAKETGAESWSFPPLIPVVHLQKIDYFKNFSHLAHVVSTLKPRHSLRATAIGSLDSSLLEPVDFVLPSAACYNVYFHLEGRVLPSTLLITTCAHCFRNESHYKGLRRLRSFTMREIVCVGTAEDAANHLIFSSKKILELADFLGLAIQSRMGQDPFFDQNGDGARIQRLVRMKEEFVSAGKMPIASTNSHLTFFGTRLSIRMKNGKHVHTSCVGMGLERWIEALMNRFDGDFVAISDRLRGYLDRVNREDPADLTCSQNPHASLSPSRFPDETNETERQSPLMPQVPTNPYPTQEVLSNLDESSILGGEFRLVSARNAVVILEDSRRKQAEFVDLMSSYGAVNFGHCNPQIQPFGVIPADLVACTYPDEAYRFASWLLAQLKLTDYAILFQVGGTLAISLAIALSQHHRKGKIAAIKGGFHGLSIDALAATTVHRESALQDSDLLRCLEDKIVILSPGETLTDWQGISCLIYEPIQGANGYIPLDPAWLRELEATARYAGVITIADEIQCGFYRHGQLSLCRAYGLQPDIQLFGKSMTNGLFPYSAVVYRHCLRPRSRHIALAHTYQTSALGCYAANSVAEFLSNNNLSLQIQIVQNALEAFHRRIADVPLVEEVYVTGPTLSFKLGEGVAAKVVQDCVKRLVIPFSGGLRGDRIRVAPPVTIEADNLDRGLAVLEDVLRVNQEVLSSRVFSGYTGMQKTRRNSAVRAVRKARSVDIRA